MTFLGVIAKLEHRAENRKPAAVPGHAAKHGQRSLHRIRTCVVAVRIDVIAILLIDVLAHAACLIAYKSLRDQRGRFTEQQTDGCRRQCIEHIMLARNTQLRGEFLSDRQVRRSKTVIYYIKCTVAVQVCNEIAVGIFDAICYHLAAEAAAFVPQKRLIAAENSRAALPADPRGSPAWPCRCPHASRGTQYARCRYW